MMAGMSPIKNRVTTEQSVQSSGRGKLGLTALLVVLGASIRLWAALQWQQNFDSDEAIFGLMSRSVLAGEWPVVVYGTQHLGSLESILAAGFILLFGDAVPVFRLAVIAIMTLFLGLNALLVWRAFGWHAAAISTLILSLPSFHILSWTFQPIGGYALLLVCGVAALLIWRHLNYGPKRSVIGYFGLGLLLGIGWWSNPMIVAYAASIGLVTLLQSPEWASGYAAFVGWMDRRFRLGPDTVMSLIVVAGLGLATLAFFSGACQPTWHFRRLAALAKVLIFLAGGGFLWVILRISQRRRHLVSTGTWLGLGGLLGISPLLWRWAAEGVVPVGVIRSSCPTGIPGRVELLARTILPSLAGWPSPAFMQDTLLARWFVLLLLLIVGAAAFIWFVWRYRQTWWAIVSLRPNAKPDIIAVLGIVGVLPLVLSVLGSNTVDLHSIRHLLPTWHILSIIVGLASIVITRQVGRLAHLAIAAWIVLVGLLNMSYAQNNWLIKFSPYSVEAVGSLETALAEQGVTAGYADYWGAYTLDYLTAERLQVAPYNGLNRIPSIMRQVAQSTDYFVIAPLEVVPARSNARQSLTELLATEHGWSGEAAARDDLRQRIGNSRLVTYLEIDYWSVWILADED